MANPTPTFESLILDDYKRRDALRDDEFDPYNLDEPIKPPPPPPTESLKEFKARIESVFPSLLDPKAIRSRHPIVDVLLTYDKKLVAEYKQGGWTRPHYQNEKGKLCLDWLNMLLHHFEALGLKVAVRGRKYFKFEVTFLNNCREFVFFIDEKYIPPLRRKRNSDKGPPTYCFRWENGVNVPKKGYYEFDNMTIECTKEIIMDIVMLKEQEYRDSIVANYQWNIERRKNTIDQHRLALELAARRKRRAHEHLLKTREDLISAAISDMNNADRIRDLVAVIKRKSESSRRPAKHVDRWTRWATHYANTLDIRHMSVGGLEAWIAKFKLKH